MGMTEIERRSIGLPFSKALGIIVNRARMEGSELKNRGVSNFAMYKASVFESDDGLTITAGVKMEQASEAVKLVNEELEKSRGILQSLTADIGKIHEVVRPELEAQIKDIRAARMTVANEVRECLVALRASRQTERKHSVVETSIARAVLTIRANTKPSKE